MGMFLSVYRDADGIDCTNRGLSSIFNCICVVNVEGPFHPDFDHPPFLLENHYQKALRLVPAVFKNGKYEPMEGWFMFGGNYASTSDSRLGDAIEKLLGRRFYGAIAIHDRKEPI